MRFVPAITPTIAVAIGLLGAALPAVAASGDAGQRVPCRPPLAFARADVRATPGGEAAQAKLLLAVDRRINGCRVLTPANARNGWLPEPADGQGPARKQPARHG
jgi:hypothetical protein